MSEVREIYGLKTRMQMERVARELLAIRKKKDYLPSLVKAIYFAVAVVSILITVVIWHKRHPVREKIDYVRTLAPVHDEDLAVARTYVNRILDKTRMSGASALDSEWAGTMPPHLQNIYLASLGSFVKLKDAKVKDVRADPRTPGVSVVECVGENNRRILVRVKADEKAKIGLLSIAALN